MRTKTLLLTAAMSAAAIATSVAQTVYSVNAVGYVNVPVAAGKFALLANPLNQPTNSLAAVLPDVPANTVVYVFQSGGFVQATKRSTGAWSGPGATANIDPGQGFFIKNAGTTDFTVTFVGEVPQGTNLTVNLAAGINLVGSIVPQQGKVETDLKIPAANGDILYQWDPATQAYKTAATRRTNVGQWTGGTGSEPVIGVGEGFFYSAKAAGTWTRSFSVNQ
jgi:hypothetical protein